MTISPDAPSAGGDVAPAANGTPPAVANGTPPAVAAPSAVANPPNGAPPNGAPPNGAPPNGALPAAVAEAEIFSEAVAVGPELDPNEVVITVTCGHQTLDVT